MNALILGGTHGIGKAVFDLLATKEYHVIAYGRNDYNICDPSNGDYYRLKSDANRVGMYDAFVFCAADLNPRGILQFQFPLQFYNLIAGEYGLFNNGCVIVAVSSMAAVRPAKLNPHYAASKAALESYVLTLQASELCQRRNWKVRLVRFDLVSGTRMYQQATENLSQDQLAERTIITTEQAAWRIWSSIEDAQ